MTIQNKMISKYALLLSVFFAVEHIFYKYKYLLDIIAPEMNTRQQQALFDIYTSLGFGLLLNVITAVLINIDIKKLNLSTRYVILATVLYPPVGVCAFILYMMYDKELKIVTH
jgi:hypothetical protein